MKKAVLAGLIGLVVGGFAAVTAQESLADFKVSVKPTSEGTVEVGCLKGCAWTGKTFTVDCAKGGARCLVTFDAKGMVRP